MSFWTAIVTIVAIVFFTQMIRERREARLARRPEDEGVAALRAERERQMEGEIAELKERIKVLERIAYDDRKRVGAASLADEIESLRD